MAAWASAGGGRSWLFILLGVTTLASVYWSIMLIKESLSDQQRIAAFLFLLNIVLVFSLSGMARFDRTVALQWIDQGLNTLASGAFLGGAYLWRTALMRKDDFVD